MKEIVAVPVSLLAPVIGTKVKRCVSDEHTWAK
jgi:hypothetical protein